jgi:type I restriction enzyme S subunit
MDGDRSSKYPKKSELHPAGIPFLNSSMIVDNRLLLDDANFISDEKFAQFTKGRVRRNDIIVTTRGNGIGKAALFGGQFSAALINAQMLILRANPEEMDPRFLFYQIIGPHSQSQIRGRASGSAQPQIPIRDFRDIELIIPLLSVQRRIAGILSAYDELIENSQRRVQILDAMARALYHEWFVEFRFPGHESAPRMASPLGDIPQGWDVKHLDEMADIKGGKQLQKEEIHERGQFPVFGGNGIQGYSQKWTHQGFVVAFGRVGAYCGAIHWSYEGAWLNNNSSSVVPVQHDELVLHHLLGYNFAGLRGGAAQPFISNSALSGIELLHPDNALADKFCSLVRPMHLQQVALEKSIANLRRTRELLLPRLLTGQVTLTNSTA